jgi:flagellar hook-associated protein 1 FlgK
MGFESLLSALRVQSLASRIVNQNISNATTRGYSRQTPVLSSTSWAGLPGVRQNSIMSPAILGGGISLYAVERIRDEFLDGGIRFERSIRGQQSALLDAYKAMQVIYPEIGTVPGPGLSTSLKTFFADWTALAAAPGSAAARATMVADTQAMAALFNTASRTLSDQGSRMDAKVRDSMFRINSLLSQVAGANEAIQRAGQAGASANEVMDKRDLALTELSELVNIDTVKLADGTVMVMTGNARTLVRGAKAAMLTAAISPHESAYANIGLRDIDTGVVADITAEITGGKLDGQLAARDSVIPAEILKLDMLANSLIRQVNVLHRAGYGADPGSTTGLDLLVGSEARDIAVSGAISANPLLLAASRIFNTPANGEQAQTIGMLENMVMNMSVETVYRMGSGVPVNNAVGTVDPDQAFGSIVHTTYNGINPLATNAVTFLVPPVAAGTILVNGTAINWTNAESINDIVAKINDPSLGLGVHATFDFAAQRLLVVGDGPVTVTDAVGNLAAALALPAVPATGLVALGDRIDPDVAMNQAVLTARNGANPNSLAFRTAPAAGGTLYINGVGIVWNNGDSINDIVSRINTDPVLGLSVQASFDYTAQKFILNGNVPITVYDDGLGGNLTQVFDLQARVSSLAPVNNGVGPLDRPVDVLDPLQNAQSAYRTISGSLGTMTVNGIGIPWDIGQDLDKALGNLNVALAPAALFAYYDPSEQLVNIWSTRLLPATALAPVGGVSVIDTAGNLAQVLNVAAQPTFGAFNDAMLAEMQARLDNAQSAYDQADAAVGQLEFQQDAISKVDLNEEKAKLMEYLRAYEAAIRALAVMDEALNVLINKMAVTSSGTSSESVI